jgi:bifunctional DNA-binding transcriptional regulator/antitoxin component of YhaV-PrlF toxin-antitoxin module
MPKVSAKRQITLPIEQCQALGIEPGDEVESFVADGQLTIVKKVAGAAKGILSQVQPDSSMTDEESRQSGI